MAEALGVASALIAIVQISGNVVSLCYQYRQGIKDAPRDAQRILQNVRNVRDLIERLLQMSEDDTAAGTEYLPSLKKLDNSDGTFTQCHAILAELETLLSEPVSQWRQLGRRLIWPLKEKDVNKALSSLREVKGVIDLALTTDASASIAKIRGTTRELQERILDFQRSIELTKEQRLAVMKEWLGAQDQTARHDLLSAKREPGTLTWLLNGTMYNEWKADRSSSIWLHGIPGCGKSVISAAVGEDLKKTVIIKGRMALAYFYFDFSNEHASTVESLLRSVITQLSMGADDIPEALDRFATGYFDNTRYHSDLSKAFRDGIAQPSYDDLVALLKSLLIEFERTYVVIDALDECGTRDEVLELMSNVLSWNAEGLHVFLTSRSDATISSMLQSATKIQLSIAADHTKDDIELFIRSRIRQHKKLSKWPSGEKQDIEVKLMSRADGMFRWVHCVLELLGKSLTQRDIKKTLQRLPTTLAETYQLTLASMDDEHREYALKILLWLAVASRPMYLEEAAEILAFDGYCEQRPTFEEDLRLSDPSDITTICSTLAVVCRTSFVDSDSTVREATEVRLAHHTVKEFVLSLRTVESCNWPCTTVQEMHSFAAKSNLVYMLMLKSAVTESSLVEYPLSRYAAESWIYHWKHSVVPTDSITLNLTSELMQDQGRNEAYKNWCRLFNPDRPWCTPSLVRKDFASPVYYASLEGLKDLVQRLLDDGHSSRGKGGFHTTPIEAAAVNGFQEVVALLIESMQITGSSSTELTSALTSAAEKGKLEAVRLLLANNADPNGGRGRMHSNPLLNAARHGYTDVVRLLIDAGANPNFYHEKPRDTNPLEAAARRGYNECVSVMLPKASEKTALAALEVVRRSKDRRLLELFIDYVPGGAMTYAAMLGHDNIVIDLLQRGVKPETKLHRRYRDLRAEGSALVAACGQGNLDLAKRLLAAGADVNAPHSASDDTFALNNAARSGNAELVSLLLEHGAEIEAMGHFGPPLQTATYSGHLDAARVLVLSGASLGNSDGTYGGPVQGAVLGGHLSILEWLVTLGADVNMLAGEAPIRGGAVHLRGSPLQAAVALQQPVMVECLLEHGADPNVQAARSGYLGSMTPLCVAAESGNVILLQKLLAAGAAVNKLSTGFSGSGSALFYAVLNGHESATKTLLAAEADPNVILRDHEEYRLVLSQACMGKSAEIVRLLLGAGADVHKHMKSRSNHEPPLHTAARESNEEVIRLLIEHGADVNEQIKNGWSALHVAARKGMEANLQSLLFDHDANPKLTLSNGSQPIHSAASYDQPECIGLLLKADVDINARNAAGRTPLIWAAESSSPKAVEYLLAHGADESCQEDGTLFTALDYAELRMRETEEWHWKKDPRQEVLRLLRKTPAKIASKES